jgi:hypothetical protein
VNEKLPAVTSAALANFQKIEDEIRGAAPAVSFVSHRISVQPMGVDMHVP